jgi:NhaP-type Na+/H+ or K+/H+ antiporter
VVVLVLARPQQHEADGERARLSTPARFFIGWFGPRGLSSLLFALLLVSRGVPEAEWLLSVVGIVVLISVVVHGATVAPLAARYATWLSRTTLPEEREGSAAGLFHHESKPIPRITPTELASRLAGPNPPLVLDVRSRSEYDLDQARIPGSIRVLPDRVGEWVASRPHDQSIAAYCT